MNRQINGVEQPQGEPAASAWREGEPPHPWNSEWFLARMRQGGIVVLRPLPEEYTYDYTTADGTYVKRESIVQWAQLSISSYVAPKDTHADPGEVERLRERLAELEADFEGLTKANDSLINQRGEAWMERDRLRAQLAERDVLRWRPYVRGKNEPAPGVEVLVRYARQWPNDKSFYVTGALLHKAFDDMDTLFWFNGAGESMGGTVSHWMPMIPADTAISASAEPSVPASFQQRVHPWLMECFGQMIAGDREERNHRFLEEALELVQSLGATAVEAHQLVDYVYGRPVGDAPQEVGGVMVTLAALCLANDLDMHNLAEAELARVWTKVEQIRAKQANKPQFGPLPGVYPDREPSAPVERDERAEFEDWSHCNWPGAQRQQLERDDFGAYKNPIYRDFWTGWKARAALERKPSEGGAQ